MVTGIHWISKGVLTPPPVSVDNALLDERDLLHRQGFVKIVQDDNGTTIKWAMFTSNWASLYFSMEWIHCSPGPYHLNYHSAGWFYEKYETAPEAVERMSQLIAKSDIHLSRTVYIHDASEKRDDLPSILKAALSNKDIDEEHSIDCVFDQQAQKYRVDRVGSKSAIAKFWGVSPVSYPCLTGHSYDQAVSRIYPQVSQSGVPHYDHIYAAMVSSKGEVVWMPYQRVVLPLRGGRSKKGVRVVTELAKVDISPL